MNSLHRQSYEMGTTRDPREHEAVQGPRVLRGGEGAAGPAVLFQGLILRCFTRPQLREAHRTPLRPPSPRPWPELKSLEEMLKERARWKRIWSSHTFGGLEGGGGDPGGGCRPSFLFPSWEDGPVPGRDGPCRTVVPGPFQSL